MAEESKVCEVSQEPKIVSLERCAALKPLADVIHPGQRDGLIAFHAIQDLLHTVEKLTEALRSRVGLHDEDCHLVVAGKPVKCTCGLIEAVNLLAAMDAKEPK